MQITEHFGQVEARPASVAVADRPYRILHSVANLRVGGVGRLVLRNISKMDRNRFENIVCCLTPQSDLGAAYDEAGFTPVYLDHRSTWHGGRTLLRLIRMLKEHRIDLVHTNHSLDRLYVGLAAAICQVPVVTTLHSMTVPSDLPVRGWAAVRVRVRAALEDWSGRAMTRRFVAVSDAVRRFSTHHRQVPRDRVSVVYSGIPLDDFGPAADVEAQRRVRRELGIDAAAHPVLINVGRLAHQKAQILLVRMMPRILERWPDARLIIVGEGGERESLEREISRLSLNACIALLGERSDVGALLAASDAFLFPSVSEGLGLALVEAAGAGKPIVASNCGPIPEVVEDGVNGCLVAPNDPEALAQGVFRALDSPEYARSLGQRGRQIAREKFDLQDSVRALERVYLSVLEGSPVPGC